MMDIALCILAVIAGSLSLELFSVATGALVYAESRVLRPAREMRPGAEDFEIDNPS
jgi:hypothetical protein